MRITNLSKKKSQLNLNLKRNNNPRNKNKKERRVRRKMKRRKNKLPLFKWKPDSITELLISELQENKLFSDLSQDFANSTESSTLNMDSSKFTLPSFSLVHPKEDLMYLTSSISAERVVSLNLLNFTSKCASWLTSKECFKSVLSSEHRTPSLIVTCANS